MTGIFRKQDEILKSWNGDKLLRSVINSDGIAQRAAKTLKLNLHLIPVFENDPFAEAEGIGAEKMDMKIPRLTVSPMFEVMMLDVCQAVRHRAFTRANLAMPQGFPIPFDGDLS